MKILKVKLVINEKPIGIKTFVQITLGNIIMGLTQGLKEIELKEESEFQLKMNPKAKEGEQIVLDVDGNTIELKDYVQNMIWRTVAGFLSALEGVPPSFKAILDSSIVIDLKVRTDEK